MKRWLLAGWLVLSCAQPQAPSVMNQVDAVRAAAPSMEAKLLAPQAYLRAEQLRTRASAAYDAGDIAGAQILSEHAIAAYEHAVVLARVVKAEQRQRTAQAQQHDLREQLTRLEHEQRAANLEAEQMELRVKVARDALPLPKSEPATGDRALARMEAARALTTQARLLCVAARLIDPKLEGVTQALAEVDAIVARLRTPPAPIDAAVAARSRCLARLTAARRPNLAQAPSAGASDALLAELSRTGELYPFRDDRGVVVTLRDLFANATGAAEIGAAGKSTIEALGRVARAHPEFPVLVVVHSSGASKERDVARGRAVSDLLRAAGAPSVEVETAGSDLPVLDPKRPGARTRNDRIEIVFVARAS